MLAAQAFRSATAQERIRGRGGAGSLWRGPDTHLLLLLVEVVNDDPDEEVEREEGAKDDEDNEV